MYTTGRPEKTQYCKHNCQAAAIISLRITLMDMVNIMNKNEILDYRKDT